MLNFAMKYFICAGLVVLLTISSPQGKLIRCMERFTEGTSRTYKPINGDTCFAKKEYVDDDTDMPIENGTSYGTLKNCRAKMVLHSFHTKRNKTKKIIEYVRIRFTVDAFDATTMSTSDNFDSVQMSLTSFSAHTSATYKVYLPKNLNRNKRNTFLVIVNPLGDPAYEQDPEWKMSLLDEQYYVYLMPFPVVGNWDRERECETSFNTYKTCGKNRWAKFWEC